MANAIIWINRRTRAIVRAHPSMSYKSAQKKASAEYRAEHKAPAKKKASRKKSRARSPRKKIGTRKKKGRRVSGDLYIKHEGVARSVGKIRRGSHSLVIRKADVKEQIGWYEAQKFGAKTKTEKRQWSKKIADLKAIYNRLP